MEREQCEYCSKLELKKDDFVCCDQGGMICPDCKKDLDKEEPEFTKHDYKVVCDCGYSQDNFDSGVRSEVKIVKINFCDQCAPTANSNSRIQSCFTESGEKCK